MDQILIALAGVIGALGVILTAAGAHGKPGEGLDSAGLLSLIHALAAMTAIFAVRSGLIIRPLGSIGAWGFVLGIFLFAGDIALRAYLHTRLFPYAAPAGGMILIVSWFILAAGALAALRAS